MWACALKVTDLDMRRAAEEHAQLGRATSWTFTLTSRLSLSILFSLLDMSGPGNGGATSSDGSTVAVTTTTSSVVTPSTSAVVTPSTSAVDSEALRALIAAEVRRLSVSGSSSFPCK